MRNENLGMKKNTSGLSADFFCMIIVICSLVYFSACQDPVNSLLPQTPDGTGSVRLVISGVNGRTILPASALSQLKAFTFYFYEPGTINTGPAVKEVSYNTSSSYTITLPVGDYDLLVKAWADTDKTKLAAQGLREGNGTNGKISIVDGEIKDYTVTLAAFIPTDKEGSFRWQITFPAGLTSASMTIAPVDSTGTAQEIIPFTGTSLFTGSRTLTTGYYTVTFELVRENAQTIIYREILHVYQNLESSFIYEFKNEHFSSTIYTVTFVYDNGKTQPMTENRLFDETINDPGTPDYLKPIPAGLYQSEPPADLQCTFDGWFFMGKKWNFSTDKVTGNMTLTAHWKADKLVDVSSQTGNNDVIKALNYVVNETPEDYTLLIGASDLTGNRNVNIGSNYTLSAANCHLTIESYGTGERMLIASANSPLFTINGAHLTLGNNITLSGISNGTTPLISITAGTLIMEEGSKITGHTTSSPNGAVYVNGTNAVFTMNGGEITGNRSTSTSGARSGGVYVNNGTFTMNGGRISGNTIPSGQGDVFITEECPFSLSGGAQIGVVTLKADTENAVINISSTLTTGVNSLNLYAAVTSITDVPQKWLNKHVLQAVAGSGYALTTTDVGKFTPGYFINTSGATQAINAPDSANSALVGYMIDSETDIGKLVVNNIMVAEIASIKYPTLNEAIEAASGGNADNPIEITILRNITVPEPGMTIANNTAYNIPDGKHIKLSVESGEAITITASAGPYRLFTVNSGASLDLDGVDGSLTLKGNGSAASNRQGVFVYGGTFTMNNNVTITGFNNNSSPGGGVYVYSGTFTMSGGTIYGSSAGTGLANTATNGGASVYVNSGATAKYGDGTTIVTTNNTITGH